MDIIKTYCVAGHGGIYAFNLSIWGTEIAGSLWISDYIVSSRPMRATKWGPAYNCQRIWLVVLPKSSFHLWSNKKCFSPAGPPLFRYMIWWPLPCIRCASSNQHPLHTPWASKLFPISDLTNCSFSLKHPTWPLVLVIQVSAEMSPPQRVPPDPQELTSGPCAHVIRG